jgi:putative endonuclease
MTLPSDRITLGKAGEDYACRELELHGYEILARRFRTRMGEIDIVARDGQTLVFIEVKARRTTRFGAPCEAVDWRKQQTIGRIAAEYVLRFGIGNASCRFDVVSVLFGDGLRPRIEILRNAFDGRGR